MTSYDEEKPSPVLFDGPVYITEWGGYATFDGQQFLWYADIPSFLSEAQVGDPVPEEWDVTLLQQADQ